MSHYKLMALTALSLFAASCSDKSASTGNPLLDPPTAAHGIIAYDKITIDNYREAILLGMKQQKQAIEEIINNPDAPNFANTIAAFDHSGALLDEVYQIFGDISGSNSTEEIRNLETELDPQISAHMDDIYLNAALFARIKTVYDAQNHLSANQDEVAEVLNHEQQQTLKKVYHNFAKRGAELSAEQQAQLRDLNLKISSLQLQFSQNLLHETNNTYVTVESREELAGLPEANIDRAAQMAKEQGQEGKFMFNMQRPSCNPVLQYCSNRELRHKVYDAYYNRGNQGNEYDNKDICRQLVQLRLERANLLGFKNCAEEILQDRMAKTQENVYDLLDKVWGPAVEKANEELADIRTEMRKDGTQGEPEGWDYMYYSSRAKAAKYAIDEDQLSEYFEINNVLKGIFYVAEKLHGLTFTEITGTVPTYDPETQVWEVRNAQGEMQAIFYNDYYPRDGKGAGAWMTELRSQTYSVNADGSETREIPVVINVCNMTRPSADRPALQNIDNVTTMFHEFGHAMHYMFHDVHYSTIYNTETDFVELPSQVNEHWALEPEVLAVYARHYETGEPIPADLLQKLDESSKYGQGFATVEYLAASLVDMDLHTLTSVPEDLDVMKFEEEVLAKRGIPRQILPRYRVTNFSHCMGGGYTAGYYCYLWSELLDCDAFEAFKQSGDIFNADLAKRFRERCLAPGGIDDGMTMYKAFRGAEPEIGALLRNRGLSAACK